MSTHHHLRDELDHLLARSKTASTFAGAYPTDFRGLAEACALFAKVRRRDPRAGIMVREFVDFMGVIPLAQLKRVLPLGRTGTYSCVPRWMAAVRRIAKGRHTKRRKWRRIREKEAAQALGSAEVQELKAASDTLAVML